MVEDIKQAEDGVLWLATWTGLWSFDGVNFSVFRVPQATSSPRRVSNRFRRLEIDFQGNIWLLSSDEKLYTFQTETGEFTPIRQDTQFSEVYKLSDEEFCLVSTNNSILYAEFNASTGQYSVIDYYSLNRKANITGIFKDSRGDIWIMSSTGLYRNRSRIGSDSALCHITTDDGRDIFGCSGGKLLVTSPSSHTESTSIPLTDIVCITSNGEGGWFVVSTDGHILSLDADFQSKGEIPHNLYLGNEAHFTRDPLGRIWLWYRDGGLAIWDVALGAFYNFYNKSKQTEWDTESYVSTFFVDKQNIVWIAGSWGGIEKAIRIESTFRLKSIYEGAIASTENSVRALYQSDDKAIYAGTKDGKIHLFSENLRELATWDTGQPPYSIAESENGKIWIGSKGGGVVENMSRRGDMLSYRPVRYRKSDQYYNINGDLVYCVTPDPEGDRLWVGSFDGGISYVELGDRRRRFISKKNRLSLPTEYENRIRFIGFSPQGKLYACGNLGIFCSEDYSAEPEEVHFVRFESTATHDIQHIMFASSGKMYASSFGKGLIEFASEDDNTNPRIYTTRDGLLSDFTFASIEDSEGNIWISSFSGLNKLNPQTGSLIGYSYEKLGWAMTLNEGAPFMSEDGTLYFPTNMGILYFNPKEISSSQFIPRITVNYLYISGQLIDRDELSRPINITTDDVIRLEFRAVDMADPEHVSYSYSIKPGEWIQLGTRRIVDLDRLRRGRHTLRLRSTNADGYMVDNEVNIIFRVKSTGVQASVWIAGALAIILLGVAVWFSRKRLRGEEEVPSPEGTLSGENKRFVDALEKYLQEITDDPSASSVTIASALNVSRSTLFTRSRSLLGKAPMELLRDARFKKAKELLKSGGYSIAQIAYMTGFNDSHYFSKAFKKQFGVSPSDFIKTREDES